MKRTLIAAAILALAAPAAAQTSTSRAAAAQTASATTALAGAERDAALAEANRVLNGVRTLQGRFTQSSPDGSRATGAFYLQRPGKLRFEYDPPASLLIVSDGSVVSMRDRALRSTERTPLRSTPLNLILRAEVNLARDARILRVSRWNDWTLVTARDRSGATDGQITLHFQGGQLRSWDVVDATGARTRVALTDITAPASIDRRLFRMDDMIEQRPGPR